MRSVQLKTLFAPIAESRPGQISPRLSYGGNQNWYEDHLLRQAGCGPTACADVIWHLTHSTAKPHTPVRLEKPADSADFLVLMNTLAHRYMPIIPYLGLDGLRMALGLNLYFLIHRMPYRAHWGCLPRRLFFHMEEMLSADIPVILSVGGNFPFVWGKHRLNFYVSTPSGLKKAASTKAHFVVATAVNDRFIQISSWGKKYYISRREYESYIRRHSSWIFSNIMVIRRIS